jgi:hypothetical protein
MSWGGKARAEKCGANIAVRNRNAPHGTPQPCKPIVSVTADENEGIQKTIIKQFILGGLKICK